jgi:hypothetical protein
MLSIDDGQSLSRALALPLDPPLAEFLRMRQEQLGGEFSDTCRFLIFQAGDRPRHFEATLGWDPFKVPPGDRHRGDASLALEWIEDHGTFYELAFQFTEDFTHVVIVENSRGVHRDVLDFCRTAARQHA